MLNDDENRVEAEAAAQDAALGPLVEPPPNRGRQAGDNLEQHGVTIVAWRKNRDGKTWSIVIRFKNLEAHLVELVIPRKLARKPESLAELLAEAGADVDLDDAKAIARHILKTDPKRVEITVDHIGWISDTYCFMAPEGLIGKAPDGVNYVYAPEPNCPVAATMRCRGTLEGWKKRIAEALAASDAGVFAIAFALSIALASWMGREAGAFHYSGPSSSGKSTAGQAGASVWGCGEDPAIAAGRSHVMLWNTTLIGLEISAAAYRDVLLVLDEIKQAAPNVLDEGMYLLVNGVGKSSAMPDRKRRDTRTIFTGTLSTGEMTIVDAQKKAGKPVYTGQLVRMPDIPVGSSIFGDMDSEEARTRVDAVKRACAEEYGVVGPVWVDQIIRQITDPDEPWSADEMRAGLEEKTKEITAGLKLSEAARRAARRFAMVAYAGEIATFWGLLPYEEGRVTRAARALLEAWLGTVNTLSEGERGMQAVSSFLKSNPRRFQLIGDATGPSAVKQAGYRAMGFIADTGPYNHYLVSMDAFRGEALDGCDYGATIASLKASGLLRLDKDGRHPKVTTPDGTRPRCIWIHASIFEKVDDGLGALAV